MVSGADGVWPRGHWGEDRLSLIRDIQKIQKVLNLQIKYRESFRPFAPSVLEEHLEEWFDLQEKSPYMLLVANVAREKLKKVNSHDQALWGIDKLNVVRSSIPAVTHVDNSARVQTVSKDTNPRYHDLISHFYKKNRLPSFNQYQLQHSGGTHCLHSRGCFPLLYGNQNGYLGYWKLFYAEKRSE